MNDNNFWLERTSCEDCGFKYIKADMFEKEVKIRDKAGKEEKKSKWYCRRCAPRNMG